MNLRSLRPQTTANQRHAAMSSGLRFLVVRITLVLGVCYFASAGGHLVALLGATNGMPNFEGEGSNAEVSSTVESVVDIDGTAAVDGIREQKLGLTKYLKKADVTWE